MDGQITRLSLEAYKTAVDHGFHEQPLNLPCALALIHSEVSEALEADRKGKRCIVDAGALSNKYSDEAYASAFESAVKNTFEDELADIVIRVMNLSACLKIDLEGHIKAKMQYNHTREKYHGKKY